MSIPADPRAAWSLPPLGELPSHAELEPLVTRVLAANPSPMTLDGTNTYVVGARGSGQAVVVDPGPDDPAHLSAVEEVLTARDARCVAVLVTHHHGDHAEAALPWGRRFGAPVAAASRAVAGPEGRLLQPGERLTLAGTSLDVVPTPGHTADHLAFRLESGAVLVGDHVLGRGTSVVTHPEGDVVAYLESLRRVHDLGPSALYCGHGPELTEDPGAVLVTHHHGDHAEAALPWGRRFAAPVAAASGTVAGPGGRLLGAGERLTLAGTPIDVVPTPGHTADHLAFRLESGAVLVGDHVLGRGTSVVTHPEGDVVAYLESLRRVHDLGPAALYCGHGPELTRDPGAVLDFYLAHRAYRERQLLDALGRGAATVAALVATVYADYARQVWPAAAESTRATLDKLRAEGRVEGTDRVRLA